MHAVASVSVSIRGFVHHIAIRVHSWSEPTFPPVHTRRIRKNVLWRKIPHSSAIREMGKIVSCKVRGALAKKLYIILTSKNEP
jgi:hypothetical protein